MTRRTGLRQLVVNTLKRSWDDRLLGLSAEAAFWQLLSLPSLFLALLASTGYVSDKIGHGALERVRTELIDVFQRVFSEEVVSQLIAPTINDVLGRGRADVISIGFVIALWAGSSATATFVNTITIAYGMRDLRGAVRSRLLALWLYLGSVLLGVVLLPLLVLGPRLLTNLFPENLRGNAGTVIQSAYWPTAIVLLLIGLTSLYYLAPPRRFPWLRGVPGAIAAMGVFIAGSTGLRAYVDFVVSHGYTYGKLAAPIAALLFFYVLALGVLLGAEFNASIAAMYPHKEREREQKWNRLPEHEPASHHSTASDQATSPDAASSAAEQTAPVSVEKTPNAER